MWPTLSRSLCFPPARTHFWQLVAVVVGALLASEKNVFELIHSRIDEKQGRIFGRNQRGAFDDGVAAILEEFEESPADFITVH